MQTRTKVIKCDNKQGDYLMFINKKIHKFALLWIKKFEDEKTTGKELAGNASFGYECMSFGFDIAKASMFYEKYGIEGSNDRELKKVITKVNDIDLLGSVILTNWRYYNHWAWDVEEITRPDARNWFIVTLNKLAELTTFTEDTSKLPNCKIKKIELISNCVSFGLIPEPNTNVEQHLSINIDGDVIVTSYDYGDGNNYIKNKPDRLKISSEATEEVLSLLQKHFAKEIMPWVVTCVGFWEIKITNNNDETFNYTGDLCDMDQRLTNISSVIRNKLNMPNLFVFDGLASEDRIDQLKIEYHKNTTSNTSNVDALEYYETISLDRFKEELIYIKQQSIEHSSINKYQLKYYVSNLLDKQNSSDLLTKTNKQSKQVTNNHFESLNYKITIDYLFKGQLSVSGSFDRDDLPMDFSELAEDIKELINSFKQNDILNPLLYEKIKRKKSELIFCSVAFSKGGKTYYYLANDDIFKVGDTVYVPVGDEGEKSLGEIIEIEYYTKEKAPFPLEKIKSIHQACDFNVEESKLISDEELANFKSIVLCDEINPQSNISVSVWASLTNGCLLISGQDLGEALEYYFGKDEHEYFYLFDQSNTKLLFDLLKEEKTNIEKALVNNFGGREGYKALESFCKTNNIKYDFSTY